MGSSKEVCRDEQMVKNSPKLTQMWREPVYISDFFDILYYLLKHFFSLFCTPFIIHIKNFYYLYVKWIFWKTNLATLCFKLLKTWKQNETGYEYLQVFMKHNIQNFKNNKIIKAIIFIEIVFKWSRISFQAVLT